MKEHTDYKCPGIDGDINNVIHTNMCMFCVKRIRDGCKEYDKIMDEYRQQKVLEAIAGFVRDDE